MKTNLAAEDEGKMKNHSPSNLYSFLNALINSDALCSNESAEAIFELRINLERTSSTY